MSDPRPRCPIPRDARVGDVVVSRNGERHPIEFGFSPKNFGDAVGVATIGHSPGGFDWDGRAWLSVRKHDCIAFEYHDGRKPNLPRTGKPKRTQAQRDADCLRKFCENYYHTILASEGKRLQQIADRIEGKT